MDKLIIIGAGGHGKVLADLVERLENMELLGFVDAQLAVGSPVFKNYQVIEKQSDLSKLIDSNTQFILGIGDNSIREKIDNQFPTISWATLIHPSAVCAQDIQLGNGTVVLANAVINASSIVGKHTIVNSSVVVDHDCEIGDFVHLSIGTMVGSNSHINSLTKTSIGERFSSFTNNQ